MATYQKETRSLIKDSDERSDESKIKINEVCSQTSDIAVQITNATAKINENSTKVDESFAQINKVTASIMEIKEKVKDGVGGNQQQSNDDLPNKVSHQVNSEIEPKFNEMKQSFDEQLNKIQQGFNTQLND